MLQEPDTHAAGDRPPRRLFVYNGGFLMQPRVRRIMALAGWDIRLGLPGDGDFVGVWGKSPTAPRGEAVSERREAPVLRVEDALLRSVLPGRLGGSGPIGLMLDRKGVHFDSAAPSELEDMLAHAPLDDTALLDRARAAMEQLRLLELSKYNAHDLAIEPPIAPYVLVLDQTKGDASVQYGGANAATFKEMLVFAQEEHPGAQVIIKSHPETAAGAREGYFTEADERPNVRILRDPVAPYALLEGAMAVYTVSSGMGFEAIMAGHKPRVFGQPFYAGWGLTQDEFPVARRQRKLTRAQLFAIAMILYPKWYDPFADRLCDLETAINNLAAETRAFREDRAGYVAAGMRLWKRRPLQGFYGAQKRLRFAKTPDKAATICARENAPLLLWGSAEAPAGTQAMRIEDGFIRSRGLGADLTPPLSLVRDDIGIYYDPTAPSRLETLIIERASLPDYARRRAEALIAKLAHAGLSKYNLGQEVPPLPGGHRILVPGQVEDDASIRLGCTGTARTNLDLLKAARLENPTATVLYKPHPDVEAGLRPGRIDPQEALEYADAVLDHADPIGLIEEVDEVWTLTSLLGFEALLRGKPVTCLGAPFYAGWGLTRDLAPTPARRAARPSLAGLTHATLIDYPRYIDPVTLRPCPVETVIDRLGEGGTIRRGFANRSLAKLQGVFASYAHLWR